MKKLTDVLDIVAIGLDSIAIEAIKASLRDNKVKNRISFIQTIDELASFKKKNAHAVFFYSNRQSQKTIDDIRKSFVDRCCYFPSYEIMMDDLRDYRFYEVDMVHPNAQAIEYIREKFFNAVLSPSALQKCGEMESLLKKIEHRSIHETPEQKERRIADANEAIRHILLKS